MAGDLLAVLEDARRLGFLGPGPIADHVHHARGFARAWGAAPPARAVDLGSGGGVPGLVLARRWPATVWVLLDANQRRTDFLHEAVARLGLGNADVRRQRAEEAGRDPGLRGQADLVTARGFGPPPVTAECAAPLLRVGGCLVVSEPPEGAFDQRWPSSNLGVVGLAPRRLVHAPAAFAVLHQAVPCPERYPRRVGVPAKRPLFHVEPSTGP